MSNLATWTGERIAVYAGSFDPFTNGHLDITRRGAKLFDRLIVAVGDNPAKRYLLPFEQRTALIRAATGELSNVSVDRFSGLLVDYCRRSGAGFILRGLRSEKDLAFETPICQANQDMAPEIETIFLLSHPQQVFVSSSIVKEIALNGGDIGRYVPAEVARAVAEAYATDVV